MSDERGPPPERRAQPRGGAGGLADLLAAQLQKKIEQGPLARSLTPSPPTLPPVEAPRIDDIEITVPEPGPVTPEELEERFTTMWREAAPRRSREPGEMVADGDDVEIDVIGYARGHLVPFSARQRQRMAVAPQPMLPGLAEGLVGMAVGQGGIVAVQLPDDYPVGPLRGAHARFVVDILTASEVSVPDPEAPGALSALGRGDTLDEVMESIAAEIDEEKGDALLIEAQDRVLDELAVRVEADVPGELVNDEILRRWGELEGRFLAKKGFSDEEQAEALAGWQQDSDTRLDALRRIRLSLALRAIIERDGLVLEEDDVKRVVKDLCAESGLAVGAVRRALRADSKAGMRVLDTVLHIKAVEHVMAKVRFQVADASAQNHGPGSGPTP